MRKFSVRLPRRKPRNISIALRSFLSLGSMQHTAAMPGGLMTARRLRRRNTITGVRGAILFSPVTTSSCRRFSSRMMASTSSRDRSTFMSALRRSTSSRETAARRRGRKGEPTSAGFPTNNSVKIAVTRSPFPGRTRAITTFHNPCPLSQEPNT